MSGTSVDGIDVALVELSGEPPSLGFRLVAYHEIPFPDPVREEVLAVSNATVATSRVSQLDFLLGRLFGQAVMQACDRSGLTASDLDLVGSHGQTIYHQGEREHWHGFQIASTMQIGEAACIARACGVPVVSDFRPADIAAGGVGAPLVPYVDYLLFRDRAINRAVLNVGGIANLSALPAGKASEAVIAFDTGPGNMVMDQLMEHFTAGAERYDCDGRMALAGTADQAFVDELLADPWYVQPAPKSTGRERFGASFAKRFLDRGLSAADAMATAARLTVRSILFGLERFVCPVMPVDELLVSGGGWRNPAITRPLREGLSGTRVRPTDDLGVRADAKEAIAFAVLAYESYHGRPGNLPSATGADRPVALGKVSHPGGDQLEQRQNAGARACRAAAV
jgi:anhydro-N-acetylmuramic acid kinase